MKPVFNQQRYFRQLILPEFGEQAQQKLAKATVLVVGAGGLGSPVCYYLAAAGVGRIIICDKDVVELTNLNRQILHTDRDINTAKSESAYEKLTALNPDIFVEAHNVKVNEQVLEELASDADIIADCLDNVKTRLEINQYCIKTGKPMLHAGINEWNAQLTLIHPPETPCVQCLFEHYVESEKPKPILGVVAGVVGTMQALGIIKYLACMDTGMKNQLLVFDGLSMEWNKIPIAKNIECSVCKG